MKALIVITAIAAVAGCSSSEHEQPVQQETKECMQYRTMMTAPMSPSDHESLRVACENSR